MLGSVPFDLGGWLSLLSSPISLLSTVFQIWMLVHAIRNREWAWAVFILLGWGVLGLTSLFYFFLVYRGSQSATSGFELPGAQNRQRIKELQAQVHHIDNAYQHFQLGDIYFQQGKLDLAEKSYRAALERDPQDIDIRAHLGQCLLRQGRVAEARPLLEAVCRENPKHDYQYSMMAYAEALTALGEKDAAFKIWQRVVENNSYPRAKVQFAELCLARNLTDLARTQLTEVIADDAHAPGYQRRRDRIWVSRAKSVLRQIKP